MRRMVLVALLLALACKNEEAGVASTALTATTPSAPPPPAEAKAADVKAAPMPRLIVRNAEVQAVVGDVRAVVNTLTTTAESLGGYSGDSRTWREGEQLRATITIRVPSARLGEALAALRKASIRIENETVSSSDVSQEYVDLASQLRNSEAAEAELRELMKDLRVRTKRASDVIEMYQQLTTVQGQIEQTKGRMQYLSQSAAMSSLKADLIPDAVAKPVVKPGWQALVIVKDASRALVATSETLATAIIWLLIYVLPIAALFGLPVWIAVRRRLNAAQRGA